MSELSFSIPSEHKPQRRSKREPDSTSVQRDQYGRYMLPPPSDPTGEAVPWTSVTTITGMASGNEGLRIWTERGIMDGLASSASLRAQLANSDQADRDRIREEAKTLSGLHDAREWGSACHREWQRWVEMGADYPGPPPELAADVTAGIAKVLSEGLEVVKVEQVVIIEPLQVAGRLDVLFRAPNGKLRIGDWKTGADVLTDPAKRAQQARQFAGYANCTHLVRGPGDYQVADELGIDRETAYLIHVHGGVARIYEVPLGQAWREFQALAIVHAGQDSRSAPLFTELGRPVSFTLSFDDVDSIEVITPDQWTEQHARPVEDIRPGMIQLGQVLMGQVEAERKRCPGDPQHFEDSHYPGGAYYGVPIDHVMPPDPRGSYDDVAPVPEGPEPQPATPDPPGGTAQGTDGQGNPLQPLAKDVGARRGCGECGRIGHRRGSPACLGDRDPRYAPDSPQEEQEAAAAFPNPALDPDQKLGREIGEALAATGDASHIVRREVGVPGDGEQSEPSPSPFPTAPPAPGATPADYCDGRCSGQWVGLQVARNDKGNATGAYECIECGKRATVAAVRHHIATSDAFSPRERRPATPEEQEAAHQRVVQPESIPDPPAQQEAPQQPVRAPWDKPSVPTVDYNAMITSAIDPDELQRAVAELQGMGRFTPERQAMATERWQALTAS